MDFLKNSRRVSGIITKTGARQPYSAAARLSAES